MPPVAGFRSFARWFAASLAACAALISGWTTLQFSLAPGAPPSLEPWRTLVSTSAPAASGTALSLAFVLWASGRGPAQLRAGLRGALTRGAAVTLPGYVAAAALSVVVGVAVTSVLRLPGSPTVALQWLGAGVVATAIDSGLVLGLAWRFLPRLHGAGLSLPGALSVVFAVTVPVRATAGLVCSSLLSR